MAVSMSELITGVRFLPAEYWHVIRLAQETYWIQITRLQLLVGGWSGVVVYLARVPIADLAFNRVEQS